MRCLVVAQGFVLPLLAVAAVGAEGQPVEFNRDVRPILADHCFTCHGPDAKQRQAGLRLDTADGAAANREGGPVVVAGNLERSQLWRRINSNNADEQMPPPDKGRRLTGAELATLKQWILDGAKFEKHWSLLPVRRPVPPQIQNSEFRIQNGIDAFVAAKLTQHGLTSAPPADRPTILRRVTLALTGLPPTPEELNAFLNSNSPDAYDRIVDRLLASPRNGERMAVPWLDAARYADTSGYQSDGERYMWRWRDWVIEALNANKPFDQFTIEQLAGDLLPNATLDQKIATGFNRNHRGNAEGGIIPEEYAVEYVADRVETTSTVWLGLTLGCARCHDHKYDPFTQRDFYSLFAFFNNIPEKGRAIKIGNSPPYIQAPTRQQVEEESRISDRNAAALGRLFAELETERFNSHYLPWLRRAKELRFGDWYPTEKLNVYFSFDNENKSRLPDGISKDSTNTLADSPDTPRLPSLSLGVVGQAGQFHGKELVEIPSVGDFGFFDKFSLAAWIKASAGKGGTIISRMTDEPEADGYQLAIVDDKLQFNLSKRWLDDALRVETVEPLNAGKWRHVVASYDGSRTAEGVKLFVDGQPQKLNVLLDELNQTFATKEPLRIGGGGGANARFRGDIDEVRLYAAVLPTRDVQILATRESIDAIVAGAIGPSTSEKLYEYYLWNHAPPALRAAESETRAALGESLTFDERLPTVMVMEEMATPRETHVLVRGQYDKPGERVEADVPKELPPLADGVARNRLALARWMVDRANPLTSRVFVNRVWQLHFGTGIVKTAEDFGRQGEWPSHPELLDWLASEFVRDWDVKRLHRTIVTSATFRQSSATSKSADPENRLLSRGPRLRLSAEMVRDQALAASGLFVEQLGGPSVKPLQPAGLWSELTGGDDYQPGKGEDLVRRSMYTFWKRTIPPPTLSAFDASSREACIVRESRTNTPLQALTLMNEPTFVMAAQALAKRVIRETATPTERIERAMLHVVGRTPTAEEAKILTAALDRYSNQSDLVAYTMICSTILNLDEAVTSQ